MINSTISYSLFFIIKQSSQREIIKESNILIRTLQTDKEKIYDSKTIPSSTETLSTPGIIVKIVRQVYKLSYNAWRRQCLSRQRDRFCDRTSHMIRHLRCLDTRSRDLRCLVTCLRVARGVRCGRIIFILKLELVRSPLLFSLAQFSVIYSVFCIKAP